MNIQEINETFEKWDKTLSEQQKKYISYKTMRNFAFHFDKIPIGNTYDKFLLLFSEYIDQVSNKDFEFDADSGNDIASMYLYKMADYYKDFLAFKPIIMFSNVIIWGIMGDFLLYLSNLARHLYHIPIVTLSLFLYYMYIMVFKKKSKKVYGLFY